MTYNIIQLQNEDMFESEIFMVRNLTSEEVEFCPLAFIISNQNI